MSFAEYLAWPSPPTQSTSSTRCRRGLAEGSRTRERRLERDDVHTVIVDARRGCLLDLGPTLNFSRKRFILYFALRNNGQNAEQEVVCRVTSLKELGSRFDKPVLALSPRASRPRPRRTLAYEDRTRRFGMSARIEGSSRPRGLAPGRSSLLRSLRCNPSLDRRRLTSAELNWRDAAGSILFASSEPPVLR